MSEYPLELSMHAERLYDEGGNKSVPDIIAFAIMQERERCLEIVKNTSEGDIDFAAFLISKAQ